MKIWTVVLLVGCTFVATQANAQQSSALYSLAQQYEAAVTSFERTVLRVRGIDRADERLVDRFADEVTKLRLAAKNPRHKNRIFYKWEETQELQAEVERTIFGKYTANRELLRGWDVVRYYKAFFNEEFFISVENPRSVGSVRRIENSNSLRDRYFGSSLPQLPQDLTIPLPAPRVR